jgi:hypothetical protein
VPIYSDDPVKVEQLVLAFIQHGPGIVDPAANQALALALAKLSQEPSYMAVIEKLGLLQRVLELLLKLLDMHKDSLLLQESCCIAICRIALKIDTLDVAEKQRIAQVFFNMLETDDQYVLGSTISGISALGEYIVKVYALASLCLVLSFVHARDRTWQPCYAL